MKIEFILTCGMYKNELGTTVPLQIGKYDITRSLTLVVLTDIGLKLYRVDNYIMLFPPLYTSHLGQGRNMK